MTSLTWLAIRDRQPLIVTAVVALGLREIATLVAMMIRPTKSTIRTVIALWMTLTELTFGTYAFLNGFWLMGAALLGLGLAGLCTVALLSQVTIRRWILRKKDVLLSEGTNVNDCSGLRGPVT